MNRLAFNFVRSARVNQRRLNVEFFLREILRQVLQARPQSDLKATVLISRRQESRMLQRLSWHLGTLYPLSSSVI
jgi:hypothetical protein